MKKANAIFFILVILIYVVGQFLIGSYHPGDQSFHFDAPADVDFLYYCGIINQMKHNFPPQNPAFGGVVLSQSFAQYYPTVILSYLVDTYIAIRIINVLYLVIFGLLLIRYFSSGWGIGLAIIAAGSVGFGMLNSLGIDLITRGFNHFPFFIALTIALFEKKQKWLRFAALFCLGWLHSLSAFIAAIYFCIKLIRERFSRESVSHLVFIGAGLVSAASIVIGVSDKPFYFMFAEGFWVDISDLWMHSIAGLILVLMARKSDLIIFFAVAFIYGILFHHNPFFPIFLIYYISGLAAIEIWNSRKRLAWVPLSAAIILFIGFVTGAIDRYNSLEGTYLPRIDEVYSKAGVWLENNTPSDAVILTIPPDHDWSCRLQEKRALYLGFVGHAAHLGLDWKKRAEKIYGLFLNSAVYIGEIEYVVFGPTEKLIFPNFSLDRYPVYRDSQVVIWDFKE